MNEAEAMLLKAAQIIEDLRIEVDRLARLSLPYTLGPARDEATAMGPWPGLSGGLGLGGAQPDMVVGQPGEDNPNLHEIGAWICWWINQGPRYQPTRDDMADAIRLMAAAVQSATGQK